MIPATLRYLRDCYEADNRRTTIWNVFHRSVEHFYAVEGREDVLTGFLPHEPLPAEYAHAVEADTRIYPKEKELLYLSLFLIARLEEGATAGTMVCAPLVIYPAEMVERDGHLFIAPEQAAYRVNHMVLEELSETYGPPADDPTAEGETSLVERVADILSERYITTEVVRALDAALHEAMPALDTSALGSYPDLCTARDVRAAYRRVSEQPPGAAMMMVPASAVALVPRSRGTRGVLHELSEMAGGSAVSPPVQALLESGTTAVSSRGASRRSSGLRVPAVLSQAQQQVLTNAAAEPLSLVIGPPGTGKSFTIAALAADHLSRGESVIVASKMNHAVDVVADKIEQQIGTEGGVVRAGRSQYLKDLKAFLEHVLSGAYTGDAPDRKALKRIAKEVSHLERRVTRLEDQLSRDQKQHASWSETLSEPTRMRGLGLKRRWASWRASRATALSDMAVQLEQLRDQRIRRTAQLVRARHKHQIAELLRDHRAQVATFLGATRARTSGRQSRLFSDVDFELLLQAFPIWLVNTSDVSRVLPLCSALFDVAIIDEATQCDMASALPILQRAKRAVIVGDPHQLRHISFLSRDQQERLRAKHQLSEEATEHLDYRNDSILDLAGARIASQEQVAFLNEHYRSVPSIIAFSNQTFYRGALHVMTATPGRVRQPGVYLTTCAGIRRPDGSNPEEADALMHDLEALVRQADTRRAGVEGPSIGILSPFRGQVEHLAVCIRQSALGAALFERHDLLIGTAHTFQGEERDHMFLSWAVDSESHHSALRYAQRPDVFNVSITRACRHQRVYASITAQDLPSDALLGRYLRSIDQAAGEDALAFDSTLRRTPNERSTHDACAQDVTEALRRRGYDVRLSYPLAELDVDLVVTGKNGSCAVDLIGYPGVFEGAFSTERYRMLRRAAACWPVYHSTLLR